MKPFLNILFALLMPALAYHVKAGPKAIGHFIARAECPAYQSFRRGTNPGGITTQIGRSYPLLGKNKENASHYLIDVDANPRQRWVEADCGYFVSGSAASVNPASLSPPRSEPKNFVLAVSWQAGFCELRPGKKECRSQHDGRFDASHFSLHGLWPQPRDTHYCNVSPSLIAADRNKAWHELPAPKLHAETRARLEQVMPGSRSFLQRHEWIKHGTCYGKPADGYFRDSIALLDELNDSDVRRLFAARIGREISAREIRNAFDAAFGDGAGERIGIRCEQDGRRQLITEMTINVKGRTDDLSLKHSIKAAPPHADAGCRRGIVDRAGLQ